MTNLKDINKDIVFEPISHTYTRIDGKKFISVSHLIDLYKPEFDPDGHIKRAVAKKRRVLKQRVNPKIWKTYHKFSFERNPWEKTLSHYHMQSKVRGGTMTLDEYLDRGDYCLNYPFYTDQKGEVMVDQIIKYENMNEDFGALCRRLGIPWEGSLGVNAKGDYRSDRRPYTEALTTEQSDRITKIFQREIDMHGYRFGG